MVPGQALMRGVTAADHSFVDGIVRGLAKLAAGTGRAVSKAQTGYVRSYAAYVSGGVLLALVVILATRI